MDLLNLFFFSLLLFAKCAICIRLANTDIEWTDSVLNHVGVVQCTENIFIFIVLNKIEIFMSWQFWAIWTYRIRHTFLFALAPSFNVCWAEGRKYIRCNKKESNKSRNKKKKKITQHWIHTIRKCENWLSHNCKLSCRLLFSHVICYFLVSGSLFVCDFNLLTRRLSFFFSVRAANCGDKKKPSGRQEKYKLMLYTYLLPAFCLWTFSEPT